MIDPRKISTSPAFNEIGIRARAVFEERLKNAVAKDAKALVTEVLRDVIAEERRRCAAVLRERIRAQEERARQCAATGQLKLGRETWAVALLARADLIRVLGEKPPKSELGSDPFVGAALDAAG